MRKLLFWLFIFVALFLTFPEYVLAVGEFQANYEVRYDVSPSGSTIVTQSVGLTNKLTNLYPKQYSIIIDSDKISDVIASDGGGVINANVSLKDGKTTITLPFNEQVVGVGKTLSFTLRYQHNDVAHKNGRIWEINVPGVENDPDLGRYRVSLTVPPSFGPNAYLSPVAADRGYWTKDQMIQGGISAAYGDKQVFIFNLHYAIANPTVTTRRTEIALPPDTEYQDVSITSINPQPKTVIRDADGNWLAQYDLLAGQKMDINAELTIAVYLRPKASQKPVSVNPSDYVKPLQYWEVYDPKIVALAKQYKTPREIYTFVVQKLTYDYGRVSQNPIRRGAIGALADPTRSICMEFTDLFIAIARAAGIPAREVVGFAYTTNSRLRPLSLVSDVLHAWPEYYDSITQLWT
ncbi:transglutaminase domain-containing protein, partial [Candidatus Gottesmanbacteria bacterium]|nr:transglutaminase domain-containing protein [Candidatus Gottesmanbacteria bacterium]